MSVGYFTYLSVHMCYQDFALENAFINIHKGDLGQGVWYSGERD